MALTPHAGHFFARVCLRLAEPDSGPDPEWQMDVEEACRRLDQMGEYLRTAKAHGVDAMQVPAPVHLVGVEPFHRPDDLDRVLSCARDNLLSGEITTGVAWVESPEQVRGMLQRFAGRLHSIEIALRGNNPDEIDKVDILVTQCRRANVFVSIRCSVGPGVPFPKGLLALETLNRKPSFIQSVPDTASILALNPGESRSAWLLDAPPRRRCAELFTFVIVAGGDCYPCLEGAGAKALSLGSLDEEPALDIIERALASRQCQFLRHNGPHRLFLHLRQSPSAQRLEAGYVDACHFHRQVLADPLLAAEAARFDPDFAAPETSSNYVLN